MLYGKDLIDDDLFANLDFLKDEKHSNFPNAINARTVEYIPPFENSNSKIFFDLVDGLKKEKTSDLKDDIIGNGKYKLIRKGEGFISEEINQKVFNETDSFNPTIKKDYDSSNIIKRTGFDTNLNLTYTPINFFQKDELMIYFKDKLYSLTSNPNTNACTQKIELFGESYYPIELGSFLDFEMYYLNSNKKEIESFKMNYIKKLTKKDDLMKSKYNSLANSLKKEDSLDSLVKNYFFPITNNVNLEDLISKNKDRRKFSQTIDLNKIQEIKFNHKKSFFQEYLKHERPILITCGNFYELSIDPRFIEKKEIFESKYKKFIEKKIKQKIKKSIDFYFNDFLQKDGNLRNLNNIISTATSAPHNNFGADKISANEYVLFKKTGEYGVEWEGNFYLFPSLKIGLELTKTSSGYKIGSRAFAYKSPQYKHPYIQGAKGKEMRSICPAGQLDMIHSKIGFNPVEDDKGQLMISAKLLLDRFENIIKRGHNSDHDPCDSIPKSAKLLSRTEANQHINRGVEFFKKTYGN